MDNQTRMEITASCTSLWLCFISALFGLFGGSPVEVNEFEDSMYLLDLRSDDGWKTLVHIKCPLASNYVATISSDGICIYLLYIINGQLSR